MNSRWARPWFAVTAALVAIELVITCINAADNTDGHFHSAAARVFNVFWYFTIQSNILVGVTCLLLALQLHRTSTVFAVFRLMGIVAISVTFVVFHIALSRLLDLDGWAAVANSLQHTIVPIVAVAGWLMFGPRRRTSARVAAWTVLFPIVYIVATAIRGPLVRDWYPYPFADVAAHGYLRVILNGIVITLFFWLVAAGATWVDRRLPAGSDTSGADAVANTA